MEDMHKNSNVLYSAVVLDAASRTKLLDVMGDKIPNGWKLFAHHLTIAFGKGVENKNIIGREANMFITDWAISDKVIAVKVSSYPNWLLVENAIPHITVAVNTENGGKPVNSNDLTKWQPLKQFVLDGVVTEVKKNK